MAGRGVRVLCLDTLVTLYVRVRETTHASETQVGIHTIYLLAVDGYAPTCRECQPPLPKRTATSNVTSVGMCAAVVE